MKNFKQLKIWQKGVEIAIKSFKLTSGFPKEEKFGLGEIALGSAFELETQVLISESINFGDAQPRAQILKDLDEEQKMLISFVGKLNHSG